MNGSALAVYSTQVHPSDRRTSPPRPNPKGRNRRNRARYTGMMTKRMITTSGTTIRRTNRVTVAKRGRGQVEGAAQPSGSGRWDVPPITAPSSTKLPARYVGERPVGCALSFIRMVPGDQPPFANPFFCFNSLHLGPIVDIPSWVQNVSLVSDLPYKYMSTFQPFPFVMLGFSNCSLAYTFSQI